MFQKVSRKGTSAGVIAGILAAITSRGLRGGQGFERRDPRGPATRETDPRRGAPPASGGWRGDAEALPHSFDRGVGIESARLDLLEQGLEGSARTERLVQLAAQLGEEQRSQLADPPGLASRLQASARGERRSVAADGAEQLVHAGAVGRLGAEDR